MNPTSVDWQSVSFTFVKHTTGWDEVGDGRPFFEWPSYEPFLSALDRTESPESGRSCRPCGCEGGIRNHQDGMA
jgi:hypothetical protein